MKHRAKQVCRALALAFASTALIYQAHAAGTAAGKVVANTATINFQVDSIAQTAVSDTYNFTVDRKINMTLTNDDGAAVPVTPGSTGNVMTFTLTNTGNDIHDFDLSIVARSGSGSAYSGTDADDADSISVFAESGDTLGYQSGEDTSVIVDALAADAAIKVYFVADFDSGTFTDGEVISYHLVVEAREDNSVDDSLGAAITETSGADTSGEDTVFVVGQGSETSSDGTNDSKFSEDGDYVVSAANLTVTKSSTVISDPENSTTNPKAIPGAIVRYSIQISNAADAATATNITLTDDLSNEINTEGTITFETGTIKVTAPNINGGSEKTLTDADDADEGDWDVTASDTVTVTGITLAASESATITFEVEVQ